MLRTCSRCKTTQSFSQLLPPLNFSSGSTTTLSNCSAALTNFKKAKLFFRQQILAHQRELTAIYVGDTAVQSVFRQLFPELVESRGITELEGRCANGELFGRWTPGGNEVQILMDDTCAQSDEHVQALFVGGPSALTACLLYQLRYPAHRVRHVFADRFDSNYDGSANYYHQRDAAPVYINRVNRGPYCVYIDLYKRIVGPRKLARLAETDRHHVKISLNWNNIRLRHCWTIFLPNFWHMVTDLWLKEKKSSKIAQVIQHTCRTIPIVNAISRCTGMPVESMLIHGKNKANYVGLAGAKRSAKRHFNWLNKFATIPFEEIARDGYGSQVTEVLNFPKDGLISPMVIDNLRQQIAVRAQMAKPEANQQISRTGVCLNKLFVTESTSSKLNGVRISRVEWTNLDTGQRHCATVDRVFLSLGPSGQFKIVPPTLTWTQHALSVLRGRCPNDQRSVGGYKPTGLSLRRHTVNNFSNWLFGGTYCLKDFIWAAGSSSVLLVGVDLRQATAHQLDVFWRLIDGANQHWTLIAQRDVTMPKMEHPESPPTKYRFFAIQMTGGGHFPSRFVPPDYLLNLLHTTEAIFGLDSINHAIYDLVQSTGCGRRVSAQNTITFQSLGDNAVVSYALGGIGMSTMFANGEKMVQIIEQTDDWLMKRDKSNQWKETHLDGIDYSFVIDEQRVKRALGFDCSLSKRETKAVTLVTALTVISAISIMSFNYY